MNEMFNDRSLTAVLHRKAYYAGSTKAGFPVSGAIAAKYSVSPKRGALIIMLDIATPFGIVVSFMEYSISLVCSWTYLSRAALMLS